MIRAGDPCPNCGATLVAGQPGSRREAECQRCGWPPIVGTSSAQVLTPGRASLERTAELLADPQPESVR